MSWARVYVCMYVRVCVCMYACVHARERKMRQKLHVIFSSSIFFFVFFFDTHCAYRPSLFVYSFPWRECATKSTATVYHTTLSPDDDDDDDDDDKREDSAKIRERREVWSVRVFRSLAVRLCQTRLFGNNSVEIHGYSRIQGVQNWTRQEERHMFFRRGVLCLVCKIFLTIREKPKRDANSPCNIK